jgi:CRP-like cAMP-binding protein
MRGLIIDKRSLVASIPVFSQLDPDELDGLLDIAMTRTLEPGDQLFEKGSEGREVFAVMEGRLKATAPASDGRELVFSIMEPGEVFGEIALFDRGPRSAAVIALDWSRLLVIYREDFLLFLERHPSVAVKLLSVLATRIRRVSSLVEDTVFMNVPARLAKRLVGLARLYGEEAEDGLRIGLRLSQRELGELIGASRETINKQLRSWTDEGLLTWEEGQITILSMGGLETLALLSEV